MCNISITLYHCRQSGCKATIVQGVRKEPCPQSTSPDEFADEVCPNGESFQVITPDRGWKCKQHAEVVIDEAEVVIDDSNDDDRQERGSGVPGAEAMIDETDSDDDDSQESASEMSGVEPAYGRIGRSPSLSLAPIKGERPGDGDHIHMPSDVSGVEAAYGQCSRSPSLSLAPTEGERLGDGDHVHQPSDFNPNDAIAQRNIPIESIIAREYWDIAREDWVDSAEEFPGGT